MSGKTKITKGQKVCNVIDHLVEALGNEPSSSLRRAIMLVDIDQYPGSTQAALMERLKINKSTVNREIEWLFNYGCIMMQGNDEDARSKKIQICGYSKAGLDKALDLLKGDHQALKYYLDVLTKVLKQEKPTLRDAKIYTYLFSQDGATKQEVMDHLYDGATSTENRAINELMDSGAIA